MAKRVYEEITAKQTMNRVKEPRMPFNWSINPYRGCTHGCSFCYARATHTFLGLNADDSFQNHILLKSNAADALEAQLAKLAAKNKGGLRHVARQVGLVAIGTATDPYQPVEGKAKLTRECLKVLAKYRVPTTITTRSPLILRDLNLLREMNITSINVSVNTLDHDVYKRLEPATPPPQRRLEVVQQLVENGLPAGIFIAPILPHLTDSPNDLEELIRAAKEHRVQYAVPSVLRLSPDVKVWYFQTLQQQYPKLLPAYAELYQTAYPNVDYVNPLMKQVRSLLRKYKLSDTPLDSAARRIESEEAQHLGFNRPSADDVVPRVEQLSFSF